MAPSEKVVLSAAVIIEHGFAFGRDLPRERGSGGNQNSPPKTEVPKSLKRLGAFHVYSITRPGQYPPP